MIETPLLSLLCFWDKGKPNFYEKQIKTPNLFYKKKRRGINDSSAIG